MQIKKVLNLLTNQYFKSFSRFERVYSFMPNFNERVKDFNDGYLKLVGAVLNGDANEIRLVLHGSWLYIYATVNEKDKLKLDLLGIF